MPTTTYKGLSIQTTGTNAGTWGAGTSASLNEGCFNLIDTMLGGIFTKSLSASNYSLSSTEAQNVMVRLTGTLLANVTITTSCQGFFFIENACTGNFAITIQYTGGVGSTIIVPYYTSRHCYSDATNGVRAVGLPNPGTLVAMTTPTAALHASLAGEYLLPYGQAVSRTTYASLFALYSTFYGAGDGSTTFNMPDMRGRSIFAMDNMGGSTAGRITSAGSGISGTTFGATGGAESTALTSSSQLPAHNHTASVTDPGHSHSVPTDGTFAQADSAGFNFLKKVTGTTGSSTTGITVSIANTGSGTAFGTMNPAFLCNVMVKT